MLFFVFTISTHLYVIFSNSTFKFKFYFIDMFRACRFLFFFLFVVHKVETFFLLFRQITIHFKLKLTVCLLL